MILIGYVVEFFILYLWYKYIIKCELISSGIFRRSKKILFMQEKVSISHLLNPDRINDEQRKIMDYFRKVISDLLESTYMFIGYIILGPFICKSVFSDEEHVLWNILGYIILLCLLIISRLIEDTQKIVNVINSYTQHLMIPLEKDPELLYNENVKKNIIYEIFASFLFLLIKNTTYNKCKKTNMPVEEGIHVYGYTLESIQKDIVDICEKFEIKSLECKIVETIKCYVNCEIDEKSIPHINISHGFINSISQSINAKEILLFSIAHELAHIHYNDFTNIRKRLQVSKRIFVLLTIMLLFGIIASINSPLCIVMFFSFFTVSLLGNVMCDIRYWNQIAELRADRLAVEKYKCDKMSCVTFWKEDSKNQSQNNNNNNDNNENNNIIVKIYRKYVKITEHPSMERRMYLIEKRDRWHWWEYLEHALIVLKWRITNNGWNGEE